MKEKLEQILKDGIKEIDKVKNTEELEQVKKDLTGKKSDLAEIMKSISTMSAEDKKTVGMKSGEIKKKFEEKFGEKA